MKKIVSLFLLSAAFSVLALAADNWSGKLIDATCNDTKEQTKVASCDATSNTVMFALEVSGKIYKLDPAGNSKAATAFRNRADRAADPSKPQPKEVSAKVTGSEKDGMITVDTIEIP